MPEEFEEVTLYEVSFSGVYRVQAKNAQDALNKAMEWIEDNASKLTFNYTSYKAVIKVEGQDA